MRINWRALLAILKELWPSWMFLAGVLLSVAIGWGIAHFWVLPPRGASIVLYSGTVLQLWGLLLVAIGLSEMRRLFNRPSLLDIVRGLIGRILEAFGKPRSATVNVGGLRASLHMSAHARGRVSAPPGASLEHRIEILEGNLKCLTAELDRHIQEVAQEFKSVKDRMDSEVQSVRNETQDLRKIVEDVTVGGLHLERVGLGWLLLSTLATSIPQEIAALLRMT